MNIYKVRAGNTTAVVTANTIQEAGVISELKIKPFNVTHLGITTIDALKNKPKLIMSDQGVHMELEELFKMNEAN